ncbi:MAG TPA: YbaN family protein [Erysipelothrix sp.]
MKKIIYNILAFMFFFLAILGSFLPVLPTVPFLLLSVVCASSGSTRVKAYICNTKIYRKHGKDFVENKAMTLNSKVKILLFASIMLAFAFYFSKVTWARILIGIIWVSKLIYFIFFIDTKKMEPVIIYDR